MRERGFVTRVEYRSGNVLEQWPAAKKEFDLVILSNIIHAYSERELPHILAMAAEAVTDDGILLVHDFFSRHCPEKAALSDLNMFINTFNGRVFCSSQVQHELKHLGFQNILFMPLESDTAVLFASRGPAAIGSLHISAVDRLLPKVQAMGFSRVYRLKPEEIHVADWTDLKCGFGCGRYGSPHCPPNSPGPDKTRSILKDYRSALLLEGEPPTRDFQMKLLQAEREAFLNGFQKAFAFWAGPCSLCDSCATDGKCRNTAMARPSMEGAGIDVFETVKKAGASLRPLEGKTDVIKYFGLLLLE
jgi:predicted metal-binding protein